MNVDILHDRTILTKGPPIVMNRPFRLLLLFTPLLSGCFSPEKPLLTSSDPSLKIPAAITAAKAHDATALHQMVKDLDSDDPAVRFYMIESLKEITGNSFDYRYYDDEIQRKPALKKWRQWLGEREGTTRPVTGSASPSQR